MLQGESYSKQKRGCDGYGRRPAKIQQEISGQAEQDVEGQTREKKKEEIVKCQETQMVAQSFLTF